MQQDSPPTHWPVWVQPLDCHMLHSCESMQTLPLVPSQQMVCPAPPQSRSVMHELPGVPFIWHCAGAGPRPPTPVSHPVAAAACCLGGRGTVPPSGQMIAVELRANVPPG